MTDQIELIIFITFKIAFSASLIALTVGTFIAFILDKIILPLRIIIELLFFIPLILPPVALGLFILELFSPYTYLGQIMDYLGVDILLNWKGATLACTLIGIPLQIQASKLAIQQLPKELLQLASSLGHRPDAIFFKVILPQIAPGLIRGFLLTFARSLGEFGATMVVAGMIPGQTNTLSMGLYYAVLSGDTNLSFKLIFMMILMTLIMLVLLKQLDSKSNIQ